MKLILFYFLTVVVGSSSRKNVKLKSVDDYYTYDNPLIDAMIGVNKKKRARDADAALVDVNDNNSTARECENADSDTSSINKKQTAYEYWP
jgi:hypothetical protein